MHFPSLLRPLLRPFENAGRSIAFHFTGAAVHFVALFVLGLPWLPVPGEPSGTLGPLLALTASLSALIALTPMFTAMQRARFRGFLGEEIPKPVRVAGASRRERAENWLRAESSWRQVVYHLVIGPLVTLGGAVVLTLWLASAAAATVFVWVWELTPTEWRVEHLGWATQSIYIMPFGILGLFVSAWLTNALARLDTRAAMNRLGPSRAEQLARRVEEVTESRAGMVDAADAERRRIERDLHDGAQQRLVSMAVNLGLAKVSLTDLPEDARKVIDEAHREAKEAITELGNLVRGLHPAVLEDRGLDAALSGIAERAPLPVHVRVDLRSRPSSTVEAVAYFVVSEALANVVKHAQASRVDVTVEQHGGILLVVVADDGVGGADPSGGTGLAGLAKRVGSVDGTFSISSPVGGPTVVTVELPCAP